MMGAGLALYWIAWAMSAGARDLRHCLLRGHRWHMGGVLELSLHLVFHRALRVGAWLLPWA